MVCNSENTQTAAAIIRQSVRSFEQCGVTNIKYILKDGGTALKNAQELINTERLLCGKSELNGKNVWLTCFVRDLLGEEVISKFKLSLLTDAFCNRMI